MREITIDKLFSWGDELARKAKETFGTHHLAMSHQTCADIKERCFNLEVVAGLYDSPPHQHINSVHVHIVDGMPDGIVRGMASASVSPAHAPSAPVPPESEPPANT